MALTIDPSIQFTGPALPDAFIQHELEQALKGALPARNEAVDLWKPVRRSLSQPLTEISGQVRVRNVILQPIVSAMGYSDLLAAGMVRTREGDETGGYLGKASHNGKISATHLRCWSWDYNVDLDAPFAQGLTSRYTPQRIAERVLLATGEPAGLLTNGVELRLILSEAARASSTVDVSLGLWKNYAPGDPPDAFRLLVALGSPAGLKKLPDIIDKARLNQGKVTKDLRTQARAAVEGFVQGLLDNPKNRSILDNKLAEISSQKKCDTLRAKELLAKQLWSEALINVYRLLFILSGEAGTRERPSFSFSSTSLWRHTYSPSATLGPFAQQVIEQGAQSGSFLSNGLRTLFHLFEKGLQSTELTIKPLGGALFGEQAAPLVDSLDWDEASCAVLLDKLLRAPRGKGKARALVRISYRDLDVEELGRVYEALLELEPGLTSEPMARLKRAKLEVVVPAAQGEKYRKNSTALVSSDEQGDEKEVEQEDETKETEDTGKRSAKTKIEWIEAIPGPGPQHPLGNFYLRIGLGRKSSGSYYTPESFVRFLVQETCGPLCDERSPADDPQPFEILKLNVLDPAMGSGHFLVGACRYLAERLYEACRNSAEKDLWERIPKEVAPYLPGRQPEGESEAGLSAERARALCKRLVAVNCLYGVDKNPLAVELAKVSLWLESFAEGLPLTFLNHRLVCGDSLLGPVNILGDGPDSPMTPPYANTPIDVALTASVKQRLRERLQVALEKVHELDATLGLDESDIAAKQQAKVDLDTALRPFVDLCVAWSGGIMLGADEADTVAYQKVMELVAQERLPVIPDGLMTNPGTWESDEKDQMRLAEGYKLPIGFFKMLIKGRDAKVLVLPIAFPEVFFLTERINDLGGFDAVLGNPPWERTEVSEPDYWTQYDLRAFDIRLQRERDSLIYQLKQAHPKAKAAWDNLSSEVEVEGRVASILYQYQSVDVSGKRTVGRPDIFRLFAERWIQLLKNYGFGGLVVPSAFHANEGATGIRSLYLEKAALRHCYSFENRRKLFEIDGRFKFATIVAQRDETGTKNFSTSFYLHDDSWLFSDQREEQALTYTIDFVRLTGGDHLTFVECRNQIDFELTYTLFKNAKTYWGALCDDWGIITTFGVELHRNRDFAIPITPKKPTSQLWKDFSLEGWKRLPVHEGKTLFQYTDEAEEYIRVAAPCQVAITRRHWADSTPFYRFGFRQVAASTNERTFIAALVSPGFICNHNVGVESEPAKRPNYRALCIIALSNTFAFDWLTRSRVGASVNPYLIRPISIPELKQTLQVMAHSSLRLVCNHKGFAPLWLEQLGDNWNELTLEGTFPVITGNDARWEVRSAIDAVVVQAYGLNREQYAHVLSTFSHKRYPKAPALCLAKFDELHEIGLEAFTQKYDPYWDVPLVETMPKPVIELPEIEGKAVREDKGQYRMF